MQTKYTRNIDFSPHETGENLTDEQYRRYLDLMYGKDKTK